MGRGRAKAKQTKVARDLKYSTHGLDPAALQAELAGRPSNGVVARPAPVPEDDVAEPDDPYAKYVDDDEAED
jgi:Protein of unknown function (DUF3073)